jgi:hypothetical protein
MRCYFHLVNSHEEILDEEGIQVSDLEDAKAQALAAIHELRRDLNEEIADSSSWHLDIVCSNGALLYSIPLAQTLH